MKFFPQLTDCKPTIYGYTEPSPEYKGLIKIGYTERDVSIRMQEHYPTAGPEGITRYKVVFEESSMRDDGTSFKDHDIHKLLETNGFQRCGKRNEWFKCTVSDLKSALIALKKRESFDIERTLDFVMRP